MIVVHLVLKHLLNVFLCSVDQRLLSAIIRLSQGLGI